MAGAHREIKRLILWLITAVGAGLVPENRLSRNKTTHLLTVSAPDNDTGRSEKEAKAAQWGIPIVSIDWLEDCAAAGRAAPTLAQRTATVIAACRKPSEKACGSGTIATSHEAEIGGVKKNCDAGGDDLEVLSGWDVSGASSRAAAASGRGGSAGLRSEGGSPAASQGAFVVEPAFEVWIPCGSVIQAVHTDHPLSSCWEVVRTSHPRLRGLAGVEVLRRGGCVRPRCVVRIKVTRHSEWTEFDPTGPKQATTNLPLVCLPRRP